MVEAPFYGYKPKPAFNDCLSPKSKSLSQGAPARAGCNVSKESILDPASPRCDPNLWGLLCTSPTFGAQVCGMSGSEVVALKGHTQTQRVHVPKEVLRPHFPPQKPPQEEITWTLKRTWDATRSKKPMAKLCPPRLVAQRRHGRHLAGGAREAEALDPNES